MDKEHIARAYDMAAEAYLEGRPHDNSRHLSEVMKLLPPGASVLDLECGSGIPIDRTFANNGSTVHGLDISERQVELAQQSVPGATFEVRDLSSLQEGEFEVDAVVSLYTMYHLPRETHYALFGKLFSFLREGGVMFVTLGAKDWEGTKDSFYGVQMSWSMYGPGVNRQLIEGVGFEVLTDEIQQTGGGHHQVVIARRPFMSI